MAPVYADHPFQLIPDPRTVLKEGQKQDLLDEAKGIMACVHNALIRGLNAVYLQAPHVVPADHVAFARFAHQWYLGVDLHHRGEETTLFPGFEAILEAPGALDPNIDQHSAFHDGLEAFGKYTGDAAAGRADFDAARLLALIDDFAPALITHLTDELVSLEGLRRFGLDKFEGARKVMAAEESQQIKEAGFLLGMPYVMLCVDDHFEGGRWNFPPVPGVAKFMMRFIGLFFYSWMKFVPVDRHGALKPLYAVPKE